MAERPADGPAEPGRVRARQLPYVDPHKRRSRFYFALARLSATKFGAWFSTNVSWKLDPFLLKLSGGRLSTAGPLAVGLLESRGARTDLPRRNATLYFNDGDRVTIIASKRGLPENPAWYYNVRANPDIVYGGVPFRAELVEDEAERQRLWALGDLVFPEYAGYRERAGKAGRVIPIFQLLPR
ncbi:MAG TPA: nitroreductase/quinone reductase family protein [Solirubrobacteraceae bacterium]|nr:nitroreductase/quinone reductase family protein [Solirubrobacteraceae bacterium]